MISKREQFIKYCLEKKENNDLCIDKTKIPPEKKLPYEACMVEFSRKLPHIEYLLMNAIDKLPNDMFCFSVACTNENFSYMKEMIKKIDFPITIHCLPEFIQIRNVNQYNELLYTPLFWNLFSIREKVLIMQEDTFIFKKNMNDFYRFDYIGAPWAYSIVRQHDVRVGNGGFSFRSLKLVQEALDRKDEIMNILKTICKRFYCSTKLSSIPEDVFFSFSTKYLSNYELANVEEAKQFSTENVVCKDSMAGHQFWNQDREWKKRLL